MKSKIHLRGLKEGAKNFGEKVTLARTAYDRWKAKVKELDSPQVKADYMPKKLVELRSEARNAALKEVRSILSTMQEAASMTLPQKKLWTKESLLRQQRFYTSPRLSYTTEDLHHSAQAELVNATRELAAVVRAGRLDDESLLEEISDCVEREDYALLGVLVGEAKNRRSGGKYQLQVNEALKSLSLPEEGEANAAFDSMEQSLAEVAALADELSNPTSPITQATSNFFAFNREKEIEQPSAA